MKRIYPTTLKRFKLFLGSAENNWTLFGHDDTIGLSYTSSIDIIEHGGFWIIPTNTFIVKQWTSKLGLVVYFCLWCERTQLK